MEHGSGRAGAVHLTGSRRWLHRCGRVHICAILDELSTARRLCLSSRGLPYAAVPKAYFSLNRHKCHV